MPDERGGDGAAGERPAAETAPVRIAVVGTGTVGATFAHHLLLSGLAAEIVLINRSRDEAEGEAMDLAHAVPFAEPARVWAGDYADCAGAAITVLTAGAAKSEGGSRLDLAAQNGKIFAEIVPEVVRHNPTGILLVATNPVDVLTHAAGKLSGLPAGRVIGSGTILDTARLRALLGEHLSVDARDVQADVVGEHGDSQVPLWSLANVAGLPLADFCADLGVPYDVASRDGIARRTREAASEVVERKGATSYGVAAGLVRIAEAILRDQHSVLTVSGPVGGAEGLPDVCLSLPRVVGRGGAERVLRPRLSGEEAEALRRSAEMVREATTRLALDR